MTENFHETVKESQDAEEHTFPFWNIHLLQMQIHPTQQRAFSFKTLTVTHAQIQGVVCEKRLVKDPWIVYTVDDGTAVIPVLFSHKSDHLQHFINHCTKDIELNVEDCHSHNVEDNQSHNESQYSAIQTKFLTKMLHKVRTSCKELTTEFDVGDTVYVEGRISVYDHKIQILGNKMFRITDMNEEAKRIKRVLQAYEEINIQIL